MDARQFFDTWLPGAPAQLLELGCGSGELARSLAENGYAVTAIDPEAPAGLIFRRTKIEDFASTDSFDAVLASLSLHHVADLGVALDRVAALLAPGGRVVIDDFGWERLTDSAAERVAIPFIEWQEEHEHLHRSDAMLVELDKRFSRLAFSWEPFLFRESRRAIDEEAERQFIENGRLRAIGFRYVGES
jgi:SAM-dependent methyltransferase